MAIQRRRKWIWLSPSFKHTFSVRAWNRTSESDWASVTLNLSDRPLFAWGSGAALQARPIWWNRSIRLLWTPFPVRYRKWFDHYIIFKKEDTIPSDQELTDSAAALEESPFFLANTFQRQSRFKDSNEMLKDTTDVTAWNNFYFDSDIIQEKVYYYWVYAVDHADNCSSLPLGPNNAEWGKPQAPRFLSPDNFSTEVHDINKWMCDVTVKWDSGPNSLEPYGAEHYIIQRRQSGKTMWSSPIRIEHDYTEEKIQVSELSNFIVGREYEFRIKAVNIPGIGPDALVSSWNSDPEDWNDPTHDKNSGGWGQTCLYTTEHDTDPPAEVENADVKRFYHFGIRRGDYARLRWSRPNFAILSEQFRYYNVYRLKGTDAEAALHMAKINAHNPPSASPYTNSTGGTGIDPYEEIGKMEGTHFIDENIEDTSGLGTGENWNFEWTCEGADDTARRTATVGAGTVTGTLGASASMSTEQAKVGTYSMKVPSGGPGGYIDFNNSAIEGVDGDTGYVSMWVNSSFAVSGGGAYGLFETLFDGDNNIYVEVKDIGGVDKLRLFRKGNGITHTATINAPSGGGWHQIELRWSVSENKLSIRTDSGSWTEADTSTPLGAFAGDPASFRFGGTSYESTCYFDEMKVSLAFDPTNVAISYHYWITAVDVYDYESPASMAPNKSYATLTFAPPDIPSMYPHEANLVIVLGKQLLNFKLVWEDIPEALWYQVKLRIKPPGTKINGEEHSWSMWHYSTFIDDDRIERTGANLPSYTYPMPVNKGSQIEAYVRAGNQAGPRGMVDGWSTVYSDTIDRDTEKPLAPEIFLGECHGMKNMAQVKQWLNVTFRWKPRPFSEGIQHYQIEYNDPVEGWTIVATPSHHCLLNTNLPINALVRQFYTVSTFANSTGEDSLEFRIRSLGYEEGEISEPSTPITVNWEAWWWW